MNQVSIIILTYNNLDYNLQCIQSIREYTKDGSYEIIIVDNGSTDGTREWLKKQSDLKLIFPNENTGFPKGCNLGIEAARKENDILLLNNDIVVTPNWLDILKTCLYSSEDIGAVGPITNYAWNNQSIKTPYTSIQDMIAFSKTINISDRSKWEPKAKLVGFCMLIKRKALDITGVLDERFSPGNFEDDDLCVRITEAGYKLILCNDCFIHHYGNATFKKEPVKFSNIIAVNSQKFREKWGFEAALTENLKTDIISLIKEPRDKEMNLLEVDCGRAATLLRLKYLYPNAQLYGVESNENIVKITSKLIACAAMEIEEFLLKFNEKYFDYIILGDFLKYCKDPCNLLKKLRKYLKPEGYVIAEVPNLIHFSVLRDLLNGNFIYGANGILNKNQYNFFTYNDINNIALECGYKIPFVLYFISGRNEEDERFLNAICSTSGENMRWHFMSYKYIARFQNNNAD